MVDIPTLALNDGNTIPQLGFGVWQVSNNEVTEAVAEAIRTGYRLIDTAQGYNNEEGVGKAIRDSGVPREQLFITSKLRNGAHPYDQAMAEFDKTMQRLQLDYLDLFLIHWPVPKQTTYNEAWRALVELKNQGRIRSIGVSNFLPEHIDRIVGETAETPAVNQIELHPKYQQRDVRDYLAGKDIKIESYSPLGSGAVIDNPVIGEVAERLGKEPAQVILRWHLQQGLIVIPKSTHAERIRSNFDVFGFELNDEDMAKLNGLDDPQNGKTGGHPATMNHVF